MTDMGSRIIAAASQGAVGAVVGATLSAVTEPVVNRVLVKRIPLQQALEEIRVEDIIKFFQTTVPTNFIKFPFFEAVNVIMASVKVSPELRGMVTGAVFTTATLPITNYRYRKSMGLPVEFNALYQAYLPTVLRDIMYGIVRNRVTSALMANNPEFAQTNTGRFANMFLTVASSCILSAPGNEFRGYCLQPKDKKLPFSEFFQPDKFIRSTLIGTLIMSTALSCGALATPKVTAVFNQLRAYLAANPLSYLLIVLFLINKLMARAKKTEEKKKA
eukprot:GEMP01047724.1.p1 GENE.GEMP01047724.1~~GEMP01047724.1.p1  ORF type:complete len:274 (+),score=63.37 GEMP01047724.1:56-877(+)